MVFFCNGKNFLLRGGAEHRTLMLLQVVKNVSSEGRVRYTCTENVSKNRTGGVCQLDVPHKVVHQFDNPKLGERCHVFLLDKYLSKLPDSAKENDVFYLRLLAKVPDRGRSMVFNCSSWKKYLEQNGQRDVLQSEYSRKENQPFS